MHTMHCPSISRKYKLRITALKMVKIALKNKFTLSLSKNLHYSIIFILSPSPKYTNKNSNRNKHDGYFIIVYIAENKTICLVFSFIFYLFVRFSSIFIPKSVQNVEFFHQWGLWVLNCFEQNVWQHDLKQNFWKVQRGFHSMRCLRVVICMFSEIIMRVKWQTEK